MYQNPGSQVDFWRGGGGGAEYNPTLNECMKSPTVVGALRSFHERVTFCASFSVAMVGGFNFLKEVLFAKL